MYFYSYWSDFVNDHLSYPTHNAKCHNALFIIQHLSISNPLVQNNEVQRLNLMASKISLSLSFLSIKQHQQSNVVTPMLKTCVQIPFIQSAKNILGYSSRKITLTLRILFNVESTQIYILGKRGSVHSCALLKQHKSSTNRADPESQNPISYFFHIRKNAVSEPESLSGWQQLKTCVSELCKTYHQHQHRLPEHRYGLNTSTHPFML